MKSLCRLVLPLLLLPAASAQTQAARPPGALEQLLVTRENRLIEARKKDDDELLKQIVTANFSLVNIEGKVLEGQEAIDDFGDSDLLELSPYDMHASAICDDVAVVTYEAVVRKKVDEDEGPPPRYQHLSSTWVKQAGEWKLAFHQTTARHWGDW